MAVANWKETVKLSVTWKERKRLLYFKETNKNFHWTTVHWESMIEIIFSSFGAGGLSSTGERLKKFAELSFPTPYWGIGTRYQDTLLLKLKIGWASQYCFVCHYRRSEYWLHQSGIQHPRLFKGAARHYCPEQVTTKDDQKWVTERLNI